MLDNDIEVAITNKEKAAMMVKAFVSEYSSNYLNEEEKRGRETTKAGNIEALRKENSRHSELDVTFTIGVLKRALFKTRESAQEKHEISYTMLKHLSEGGLNKLLCVFKKIWEEGRIPASWKEAIVIPTRKPGEDPSKLTNYRPIANLSHL